MSGFLQTWFFVASFIPWFLIDRIGRKPLVSYKIYKMAKQKGRQMLTLSSLCP